MKDPGGVNAAYPVVLALRKMGHTVRVIATGKAVEILRKMDEPVWEASSADMVVRRLGVPEIVISSMCSLDGGNLGLELVSFVQGKARTVAIQDQWGGKLVDWATRKCIPDYIVVNDAIGGDIVRRAWPGLHPLGVKVLGYAALDALHGFDVEAAKKRVYNRFKLPAIAPYIYFSGQLQATGAAVRELMAAAAALRNERGVDLGVIYAEHPRLDRSNPILRKEAEEVDQAIEESRVPVVRVPRDGERIPELDLIAAADATAAMFSTALMHAAALRKPALSLMPPDSAMERQYIEETGGLIKTHPLVQLGCVADPVNQAALTRDLGLAVDGTLGRRLLSAQEEHIIVDGQNARRIAELVSNLMA